MSHRPTRVELRLLLERPEQDVERLGHGGIRPERVRTDLGVEPHAGPRFCDELFAVQGTPRHLQR